LGQSKQAVLAVEHFTNAAWQITDVVAHNHPVDVAVERTQPRMGGLVAYRVLATLKPNAPAGELRCDVQLRTDDPNTPVLDVVMEGVIQAPLVATPNHISLGNVKVNEVVSRHVLLRGMGQSFKVVKVEGEGDGIKVKYSDKAAPVPVVMIEVVPTQP